MLCKIHYLIHAAFFCVVLPFIIDVFIHGKSLAYGIGIFAGIILTNKYLSMRIKDNSR